MRFKTFEVYGRPFTTQKIVPGNTVTSIDQDTYLISGNYKAYFYSGGTGTIAAGTIVEGATSAKTAVIRGVVLESGTFGGGDAAGWLYADDVSGAFTAAEVLNVSAADTGNIRLDWVDISAGRNKVAKCALVQAIAQACLLTLDGYAPNQTDLNGITLAAGASILVNDPAAIPSIKVVDRVSGSASTVTITCFF